MWYITHEVILALGEDEASLPQKAAKRMGISEEAVQDWQIVRKSLDARKKQALCFKYSIAVQIDTAAQLLNAAVFEVAPAVRIVPGHKKLTGHIVVVGAGPAGLFAAYTLAKNGYAPVLLERGQPIEQRAADFKTLQQSGMLNEQSNACFGEGGAGAFSDGKLTARNKDPLSAYVFDAFIKHGAPEEIRYLAKPHLGTENVRKIVKSMRQEIEKSGGKVIFDAEMCGFTSKDGLLKEVHYARQGEKQSIAAEAMVLAIGHSARDTYEMLLANGLSLEQKPFAMGVRVEHPRTFIDERQYGKFAGHAALGAAEYALKTQVEQRGAYSFCMCPGGEVICSATEAGHTAVNGMSYYKREGAFSNSALVITVGRDDMEAGPLGGIRLQQRLEKAAYDSVDGYGAPAQSYLSFCKNVVDKGICDTSYKPYVQPANLREMLPAFIGDALAVAAKPFDRALPGFIEKGILIGVESRTSSPVRILRNMEFEANIKGIYPAGEGAGYAGGIMSSAIDGVKIANHLISLYEKQ